MDILAGDTPRATVSPGGAPTPANPNYALATPGAAPIGVPNFFIDKFRIPPFLLPVYQAAGIEYGVRWEVLAAINEIETDYGRNLNVSSAGALGWMQFMPPTWEAYGVDANRDGLKDPFNPVDAIFAAARYLRAAGAETDIRKAIFAYNHADWYVDSVLMRARLIGGLPSNFVGSLTGLTQGRFPVHAKATYAGQIKKGDAKRKTKVGANAAVVVEADQNRRGIEIFARRGAPVVAVNDGRIVRTGETERLGKFIQMQDTYGNTYTYGRLGSIPKTYPAPKPRKTTKAKIARELKLPKADAKPTGPASATARSRPRDAPRHAPQPPHQAARRPRDHRFRPPRRDARQAAPVRPPLAPQRAGRRRQGAARRGRLRPVRVRPDRPQRQGLHHEAAQEGLARRRRHDPRPHRQGLRDRGPARPLRAAPGRPRRPARRPEADPRRLEAARVDRDLPRQGQEPVLRRGRRAPLAGPDPADGQGGAEPPRARQPAHRHLLLRRPRHPAPARSTAACSPRSSSSPPPASSRPSPR